MVMRKWIFVAAVFVAGCGGDPDFACDLVQKTGGATVHGCTEIDGIESAQSDAAAQSCAQLGGAVVDSCSSDGEVGICTVTQGGLTQAIHFYSEGGVTAAIAEEGCTKSSGTWTAS